MEFFVQHVYLDYTFIKVLEIFRPTHLFELYTCLLGTLEYMVRMKLVQTFDEAFEKSFQWFIIFMLILILVPTLTLRVCILFCRP